MDYYREEILEHWKNPQNFGEMKKPDLVIDQVNPICGDEITFYFKLERGPVSSFLPASAQEPKSSLIKRQGTNTDSLRAVGSPSSTATPPMKSYKIKDVSFVAKGCAISVASASILSESIKNKKVSTLSKITGKDVLAMIGGDIAPARLKCAFLPLEAVRKLSSKI